VQEVGKHRGAYILTIPALLVTLFASLFPMIYGIYMSFFDFNLAQGLAAKPAFVGLGNFEYVLTNQIFRSSFLVTVTWVLVVNTVTFLLGLFIALILNEEFKGRGFYRTLYLIPWAVPFVVSATIWKWLYDPNFGPIDSFLVLLGFSEFDKFTWLGNPAIALLCVMVAQIWRFLPFFILTLLAGLQTISNELYDSAEIDGASMWRKFGHITLPILADTSWLVVLVGLTWTFKGFTLVYNMTRGGPYYSTMLLTLDAYFTGFYDLSLGRAAAIGDIIVVILLAAGLIWVYLTLKGSR
jgi:ABC-type sugar transport system permease subunit